MKSENFEQSVNISTIVKNYSVIVQTDKAVYKPGDKVQYRILVLDSETKPYDYNILIVNITDSEDNLLLHKLYTNEGDFVQVNSYHISDNTFLGDWSLTVQIDDHPVTTRKTFEVREYVLPRFEAFIDAKEFVAITEQTIDLSIYAKYNFGEFVKGKANVIAKVYDSKYPDNLLKQTEVQLLNIFLKKPHSIDIRSDLKVTSAFRNMLVELEVEFEEELTKKKMSAKKTVTIQNQGTFLIEVIRSQLKIKPGFPYDFKIVVRNPDNSLVMSDNYVEVKAYFQYDLEKCSSPEWTSQEIKNFEFNSQKKLKGGMASFSFDVSQNASSMTLTVKFFFSKKIVHVLRFPSKTREYLKARVKKKIK